MNVAEIKMLTAFGISKIGDEAEYMLVNLDIEKVIKEKLSKMILKVIPKKILKKKSSK